MKFLLLSIVLLAADTRDQAMKKVCTDMVGGSLIKSEIARGDDPNADANKSLRHIAVMACEVGFNAGVLWADRIGK